MVWLELAGRDTAKYLPCFSEYNADETVASKKVNGNLNEDKKERAYPLRSSHASVPDTASDRGFILSLKPGAKWGS